jgi:prepilin-type N-terminal cleavage/methylation domain-containing protein/prepilin-type processing-associated H-X9-DG protein
MYLSNTKEFVMSMQMRSRQRVAAFTLIELLVVIAIITILAAILFPVFARARENARRAGCQSNLKQIALGIFQYTQDYDEKLPVLMVNDSPSPTAPFGWADALQPYLKSTQIFQCPSEKHATPVGTAAPFIGLPNPEARGYTDYFMNNEAFQNDGRGLGRSIAQFSYPAQTVLLGDTGYGAGGVETSARYSINGRTESNGGSHCATTETAGTLAVIYYYDDSRHLEGTNFAFIDGHVKWQKDGAMYSTTGRRSGQVYSCGTTNAQANGHPTFNIN